MGQGDLAVRYIGGLPTLKPTGSAAWRCLSISGIVTRVVLVHLHGGGAGVVEGPGR